jgi:hypothetical protein
MFQINLFGQMHVTQAITPFMRAQGHGVIAFTSSSAARTMAPFLSHYCASKAALSAYVESLAKELGPQGIDCVSFECGGFMTNLGQPRSESDSSFLDSAPTVEGYLPAFGTLMGMFADYMAFMPGDTKKLAESMVDVIKREGVAKGKPWVYRVSFGCDAYNGAKSKCTEEMRVLQEWKDVSYSTDRDGQGHVPAEQYFVYNSLEAPQK